MDRREPPRTRIALEQRIRNLAEGEAGLDRQQAANRLERAVLNTVVSQMVPDGVVKGGTAMKLRLGEAGSRFTPDFDAARPPDMDLDHYLDRFAVRLAEGLGRIHRPNRTARAGRTCGRPGRLHHAPVQTVLSYLESEWRTRVVFELGHDEIGSTANPDVVMSDQMREIFARLGLPDPQPVPVLPVAHQVAQKLHACTALGQDGTNERAHDLVDLQLLDDDHGIDVAEAAPVARRLFVARQSHEWPPTVQAHPRWAELYTEAAQGLGVLPDVADAVAWTNDLIDRIDAAPI